MNRIPRPFFCARPWLSAALALTLPLAACATEAPTRSSAGDDESADELADGDGETAWEDGDPPTSAPTRMRDAGATDAQALQRGDSGSDDDARDDSETPQPAGDPDDLSKFKDPGKQPWTAVPEGEVADKCKMDVAKLKSLRLGSGFAVVRYGQLCYQSARDAASQMFSATKTLGATVTGIASYETRNIMRAGARTGQLKDADKATYWLGSVSYNREAHLAHVLAMVGHNGNLADGSKRHSYDTVGSVQINTLSTMVRTAIAQDAARLGTSTGALARKFLFEKLGMTSSSWGGTQYATSWTATLGDMARLGLLIIHQGVWSGERVLGSDWAYKQVHPAFEDGNTAYSYLTWLVAREGQRSIGGGSFTSNGGAAGGLLSDSCSPAALWQRYPHGLSTYKDCTYKTSSCKQKYDVGVWSAQGLGGQFIVGHPGLDLVIVAKDYTGGTGPAGLFNAVRPAIVALDPTYKGDDAAFCKAYGAGDYAPDLVAQPTQPEE